MADIYPPYANAGMASFETGDNYLSKELFSGSTPLPVTENFSVASGDTFPAFSVCGLNAAGNLAMATSADDYTDGVAATGALTFSGAGTANDTVTIGARTYTLVAAPGAANEVLIGGSAAATAANLIAAINDTGVEGTAYGTGTTENTDVVARADSTTVVGLVARTAGTAGNAIATTESGTGTSFGAATLTGGRAQVGVRAITILTAPVLDVGAVQSVAGFRAGCFNPAALNWHASYDTDDKKAAAFRGAPTPTNILIRKFL
jgi:hypothetical protein